MSVPLPPPEGELMTNRMPRATGGVSSASASAVSSRVVGSLNVLHLLAELLDLGLDRERRLLDRRVRRFREHGVGLAVELLQQEVEPLADLGVRVDALAELRDVAPQPRQLLRDVAPVGEVRDLLREPALIEFDDLQ